MGSILDHFRYGLCFGLHFGKLTGQVVDSGPFPLRVASTPQNEVAKKLETNRFWTVSASQRSQRPSKKLFSYLIFTMLNHNF